MQVRDCLSLYFLHCRIIIYIEQIESDTFDWKSIKLAVIRKISFISKDYSRYLLYVKIELKWRKFPKEKKSKCS